MKQLIVLFVITFNFLFALYSSLHCSNTNQWTHATSIDCPIQNLTCIENAHGLTSTDKRENTVFIHGYHRNREPMDWVLSGISINNKLVSYMYL